MDETPEAQVVISFGSSTSMNLEDAKYLAKFLKGYSVTGVGKLERHSVTTPMSPVEPETLSRLRRLLQVVSGWKSFALEINGELAGDRWSFQGALNQVYECYEMRQREPCVGTSTAAE
jgi:hypothetical protein